MTHARSASIDQLLHDATLLSLEVQDDTAILVFDCLRRAVDGAELSDRRVKIELAGLLGTAIGYDAMWAGQPPSEFRLPEEVTLASLTDLDLPLSPEVALDSRTSLEDLRVAPERAWLNGGPECLDRGARTLSIHFGSGVPVNGVFLADGGSWSC